MTSKPRFVVDLTRPLSKLHMPFQCTRRISQALDFSPVVFKTLRPRGETPCVPTVMLTRIDDSLVRDTLRREALSLPLFVCGSTRQKKTPVKYKTY